MNAKERIEKPLRLEKADENAFTVEWCGIYKYEYAVALLLRKHWMEISLVCKLRKYGQLII